MVLCLSIFLFLLLLPDWIKESYKISSTGVVNMLFYYSKKNAKQKYRDKNYEKRTCWTFIV